MVTMHGAVLDVKLRLMVLQGNSKIMRGGTYALPRRAETSSESKKRRTTGSQRNMLESNEIARELVRCSATQAWLDILDSEDLDAVEVENQLLDAEILHLSPANHHDDLCDSYHDLENTTDTVTQHGPLLSDPQSRAKLCNPQKPANVTTSAVVLKARSQPSDLGVPSAMILKILKSLREP
ncbi:hypothetical protein PHLGIDRAFT_157502 [Phlebiopsis gigantea 11061_1 CR5-6]|uniref:Uncharacterized protein n=1 Tax=Phlebiopsis gigantea (strain 11061_1 CR5-6) TaxID=745531 RepID=A0A0C3PU37_PHLG1|nr:hypothetical protein PHLGIDRAFT_157502 [Phlebiopsis gigantea 11061_1 CR5-6]